MRKALYVLGLLDDTDVVWMAHSGQRRPIDTGTVLIEKGKLTNYLYVVLEGKLAVTSDSKVLADLTKGEIVGEVSFVDARPPVATVSATVDSVVLAIPRRVLSGKLATDRDFASRFYLAVASFLADRLRATVAGESLHSDRDEMDAASDDELDNVRLAAIRFDTLVQSGLLR